MTTLTEIQDQQTLVDYEPTVQDRVMRVLYRLEQGEQLHIGSLRARS